MPARLTGELARLGALLHQALSDDAPPAAWGRPEEMSRALKAVVKTFDGSAAPASDHSILQAVRSFRRHRRVYSFRDLKYLCYGLALRDGVAEDSLLGDEVLYPALMDEVHGLVADPRRFRKCYQGLLSTYLNFPADDGATDAEVENWTHLRGYLRKQLAVILAVEPVASWANVLKAHENLLRPKPCARYAQSLRKGQWDELEEVAAGLAVSSQSWVWKQAVLAHVEAVSEISSDDAYRAELNIALHALKGAKVPLGVEIQRQGAASLLRRYARCGVRPEHADLLDMVLRCFGKPWLNQTAWDAYVADDSARQLIDGWVKTGLIQDFFQLLAADGVADRSRMEFWPSFVPVINDIWFVLGSHAKRSRDPNYVKMRERIGRERITEFSGAGMTNNAFIMRIGPFYMVEFGQKGRAAYLVHSDNWRIDLRPGATMTITPSELQHMGGRQMTHMPSDAWQQKFIQALCPKIDWSPDRPEKKQRGRTFESPPVRRPSAVSAKTNPALQKLTPIKDRTETLTGATRAAIKGDLNEIIAKSVADEIQRLGLNVPVSRDSSGRIIVAAGDGYSPLNRLLTSWKFTYTDGKGWWHE